MKYMSGYECNIKFPQPSQMALSSPEAEGCTINKISDDMVSPMVFTVQFDSLKFTKNGIEKFIKLSFSSPLQHGNKPAITTMIGIETQPAVLKFIKEPPPEIAINDVFEI